MLRKFMLILPVAALLAGCQSEQKTAREQELEQRVQGLERQLLEAQMASPSPDASGISEGQAFQPIEGTVHAAGSEAAAAPAPRAVQAPRATQAPRVNQAPRVAQGTRTATPSRRVTTIATPSRTASRRGDVRSQPAGTTRLPAGEREGDFGDFEPGDDDGVNAGHEAVEPRVTSLVLPAGTELALLLETSVSSQTSNVGDQVVARVERATSEDGRIVLPGGTVLHGRVTEVRGSGRVSGRARVAVDFDRIVVRGRTHEFDAAPIVSEAQGEGGRDARIVGGSAAAGAVIGAIADGKKGAVRGALIGAGAGGAAVLATKGKDVEMPSGSRWTVRVRDAIRL